MKLIPNSLQLMGTKELSIREKHGVYVNYDSQRIIYDFTAWSLGRGFVGCGFVVFEWCEVKERNVESRVEGLTDYDNRLINSCTWNHRVRVIGSFLVKE